MPETQRAEILESLLSELAEAQVTGAICLERLRQELREASASSGESAVGWPVIEPAGFTVAWQGRSCYLGPGTSYRLMARLLRRPNQYISQQALLRDVWNGDSRTAATVRSAVRHLRTKLIAAAMPELAVAIRGHGGHYGLILARRN